MNLRRIAVIVFIAYIGLTCYTAYLLLSRNSKKSVKDYAKFKEVEDPANDGWNPWGQEFEKEDDSRHVKPIVSHQLRWAANRSLDQYERKSGSRGNPGEYSVEIWSKAAIGSYLWEHVFQGKVESKMEGTWSSGFRKVGNIKFIFRTGPGVIPSKVPPFTENLVLVINGHHEEDVVMSKVWLDFLPHLKHLHNTVLILFGNEKCENDWILPYMNGNGGPVNYTYIVYDSPLIDNRLFYQWPLGVAMYRHFPRVDSQQVPYVDIKRPYRCNFLGTVYPGSSRETMVQVIHNERLGSDCYVRIRDSWLPGETEQSSAAYISALSQSDLTLCPIGMNSESYRIYEAMSYGSVPVVEDVMTPGQCGNNRTQWSEHNQLYPLRLLKEMRAPIIYIKKWQELTAILEKERQMSLVEIIERRKGVVRWYEKFKLKLREQFLTTLQHRFFHIVS